MAHQGAFHESLNMASICVLYFCENNQYAMSMDIRKFRRGKYQLLPPPTTSGVTVDATTLSKYNATRQAVQRAQARADPDRGKDLSLKAQQSAALSHKANGGKGPISHFAQRLIEAKLLDEAGVQ
jgi:hypothetical protein